MFSLLLTYPLPRQRCVFGRSNPNAPRSQGDKNTGIAQGVKDIQIAYHLQGFARFFWGRCTFDVFRYWIWLYVIWGATILIVESETLIGTHFSPGFFSPPEVSQRPLKNGWFFVDFPLGMVFFQGRSVNKLSGGTWFVPASGVAKGEGVTAPPNEKNCSGLTKWWLMVKIIRPTTENTEMFSTTPAVK